MRALVLSGGGSRGAFQAGVLDVLRERGERFDAVYGTSIGALNAALVATDPTLELLTRAWRDDLSEDLFPKPGPLKTVRWLFNRPGVEAISDNRLVKELAKRKRLIDPERLRTGEVRFACFATDAATLEPVRIDRDLLRLVDDATALDLVFTSTLLAGIFAPYEWTDPRDGRRRVLFDGGYSGKVLPFADALADGADDLTVVTAESPGLYDWDRPGGRRPRTRAEWQDLANEALMFQQARDALSAALVARPDLRARVFAPRRGVPGKITPLDVLDFRRASVQAWMDHGAEVAREVAATT